MLTVKNVYKSLGDVRVLNGVNLHLEGGLAVTVRAKRFCRLNTIWLILRLPAIMFYKRIKKNRDMKTCEPCASFVPLVVKNYFTTKYTKFFTKCTNGFKKIEI
jgi:hypothetical protein